MTPDQLAELHAKSFTTPRPWNAAAFEGFLRDDTVTLMAQKHGFLLARIVLDEAEILTLAVDPNHRRQGIAASLVEHFHQISLSKSVKSAFLEAMADNSAAIALYHKAHYHEVGRRLGYYSTPNGEKFDALVMQRQL